ncbi:LysR family transcriptional regulator [Streptomyces sp. FXJ1.4098]|uniref:LysR family transcriptional regulator n=1 Tax=Streptomyces sp. NPDC020845 TaxID=3365096 RepID=UPI002997676C|nr:LysR family transcriptional regulator [Streptomyces sp. FXJ1.4098]
MDNRISLHKLEVFCTVVELGGIGRAAGRLYVSQPVVSGHIRSLEQRLGVRLFDRTGQRLELTDAGRAAYGWARDTLRRGTELERELAGLADGTAGAVAVATSMTVGSYLLPPVLVDFASAHPAARIAAHVLDPNHIWEAVTSGLCDLAVTIAHRIPTGQGLSGELVGHHDLVLVGAAEAGGTADSPVQVTDLARMPFASTPRGSRRRDIEDIELAKLGVIDRNVVIELGHPEAIKHAVRAGLGVALLFRASVAAELADGSLREIRIADARPRLPVFAVRRADRRPSALHRTLLAAIHHALGDAPDAPFDDRP